MVLRDSTGNLQCVGKRDILGDEAFTEFMDALIETSVIFVEGFNEDERAPGGFEFEVNRVQIVGSINPERPFPINKESLEVFDEDGEHMPGGSEFLLNHRHLFLRTSRMTTMLKLRSSAFGAIHNYFREKDFIEYQAPNFVAGAVEGGSTLFEVPYFDKSIPYTIMATLCRSSDACFGTIVYDRTFIQSRESRTRRHLTEFWHAEMEMAWASNDEIMAHGEGVVRHIARTLLDEREDELTFLERDLDKLARYADSAYPRMRYDEAIEILQSKNVEVNWGDDLDYSKEKILTQDFDVPHFLTHYPKIAKPFYHRVDPSDDKYVLCHDLLAPEGYGEIIGGGERTWTEEEILQRIDEEGTPREPYQFYIDVRSYGGVPHGGFGLGVDRVVSWLAGADSHP